MPATLRHLAVNADDVQRARRFYETVFGWTFEPWGPLNYYQVRNAGEGFVGALQERRELKPGARMLGFEATMAVEDIAATLRTVEAAGGKIAMPAFYIEDVGRLAYFEDTEGNLVGAMQYDEGVFD
jgi:predicted enzyme related to lactoylglutathione lyase